jgi:hypothetical protein
VGLRNVKNEEVKENKIDINALFSQAVKKLEEVKGFHLKATVSHNSYIDDRLIQSPSDIIEGVHQNPDKMYFKISPSNKTYRFYVNGDGTAIQLPNKNNWLPYPKIGTITHGLPLNQLQVVAKHIENIQLIEKANINGIQCVGIFVIVNHEGLNKLTRLNIKKDYDPFKEVSISEASYKIWVDPETFLTYKVFYSIKEFIKVEKSTPEQSYSIIYDTTLTMDLFDYEKNTDIIFPDEVNDAFESISPQAIREAEREVLEETFKEVNEVIEKAKQMLKEKEQKEKENK